MAYRRHGLVVLQWSAPAQAWHAVWVQMGTGRRRGDGLCGLVGICPLVY